MNKIWYDYYCSPVGRIYVILDQFDKILSVAITQQSWENCKSKFHELHKNQEACEQAISELRQYFAGERAVFSVKLNMPESSGSKFDRMVWNALMNIPYGETCCYSDIALSIGIPKAARMVGQANRHNPFPIFIPCHRVIGKNGQLTGYAGNHTDIKDYLLKLERQYKLSFAI